LIPIEDKSTGKYVKIKTVKSLLNTIPILDKRNALSIKIIATKK